MGQDGRCEVTKRPIQQVHQSDQLPVPLPRPGRSTMPESSQGTTLDMLVSARRHERYPFTACILTKEIALD
jgi:hypothetical protein